MKWFVAACVAGLVHAAFSAYWALGGTWLLDTVGALADELRGMGAGTLLLTIGTVALVKAAGAVVPLLVERGRFPRLRRPVRALSWAGGALLVVYGGVNTVVAGAVLLGWISTDEPVDRASMLGHALLWDPLFALWGALLLVGLAVTRR
ncbi:DUF3995 domain-containing protein [Cryptosporangium minutisporangium]|uniref:DUF3995 domain-containing protein n=1 Tax=Cryptosporangium minutisporangium TaxID=113569 RepID=A0ABP6SZR1_9ACTN